MVQFSVTLSEITTLVSATQMGLEPLPTQLTAHVKVTRSLFLSLSYTYYTQTHAHTHMAHQQTASTQGIGGTVEILYLSNTIATPTAETKQK